MRITNLAAIALFAPAAAFAQNTNPATVTPFQLNGVYTQTFDSLASTGTTGTALPQGFQVDETGTNANASYAVGTGSSNAGNSYSFGSSGSAERALGSLGSGSVTQILFGGVLTNALGGTINSLTFNYFGEQWRLGNAANDGLTFQYRLGAAGVTGSDWTTVDSLAFAPLFTNGTSTGAALDGNLAANRRQITGTISGLSLLPGGNFGFRWTDLDSTGSDQGLAVDDLTISASLAPVAAVPEPTTWAMLIAGFGMIGAAFRRRAGRHALA